MTSSAKVKVTFVITWASIDTDQTLSEEGLAMSYVALAGRQLGLFGDKPAPRELGTVGEPSFEVIELHLDN